MPTDWIIVSSEGFEAEEVLDPRSVTDTCVACEKKVKLLERELTRNFKLFKIPLLAVERGSRVFQCPHCGACFEPPPPESPEPAARTPETLGKVKALLEQETREGDEVSLWRLRVELARKKGEHQLAREAQDMVSAMESSLRALKARIAALEGGGSHQSAREPREGACPEAPSPPEKTPEPEGREVEDAMQALKQRLRGVIAPTTPEDPRGGHHASPEEPVSSPPAPAPEPKGPSPEPSDELSDLKRLLRKRD